MYQLFGAIARANQWLHSIRVNGLPLDVGLTIFLPLVGLFAWAVAATDGSHVAWVVLASTMITYILFVQSSIRHDIVFRKNSDLQMFNLGESVKPTTAMPDFLASGRFILWEGDRTRWGRFFDRLMSGTRGDRWFLEVPATFEIRDENLFSIAAFLDPSQRFMGIRLENKAGVWTIDGQFATLEKPELGVLHLGFITRTAIRLHFRNPKNRSRKVVLTFDGEDQRQSFVSHLKASSGPNWHGLY